jgi:hypothetical protein
MTRKRQLPAQRGAALRPVSCEHVAAICWRCQTQHADSGDEPADTLTINWCPMLAQCWQRVPLRGGVGDRHCCDLATVSLAQLILGNNNELLLEVDYMTAPTQQGNIRTHRSG